MQSALRLLSGLGDESNGIRKSHNPGRACLDDAGTAQRGCHIINLVSPSHVVAQIISAVFIAAQKGLHLPLVYNTGGYDNLEALRLLDGIVDIYLPDMKYGDSEVSVRFSGVGDYTDVNPTAALEMHRQVGKLVMDPEGVAIRGLLVRHLVLPGNAAASSAVLDFIAQKISLQTYLNLMDHY